MDSQQMENYHPAELHLRILSRIIAGESYGQIAAAEFLSARTIRRLVGDLKRETGAENLAALGAEATRRGWLA